MVKYNFIEIPVWRYLVMPFYNHLKLGFPRAWFFQFLMVRVSKRPLKIFVWLRYPRDKIILSTSVMIRVSSQSKKKLQKFLWLGFSCCPRKIFINSKIEIFSWAAWNPNHENFCKFYLRLRGNPNHNRCWKYYFVPWVPYPYKNFQWALRNPNH